MRKLLLAMLTFFCTLSCGKMSGQTEILDWEFIRKTGGIEVGRCIIAGDRWYLPVRYNISGLVRITVEPMQINSMMAIDSVCVSVSGEELLLCIKSTFFSENNNIVEVNRVEIPKLNEGVYRVYYSSSTDEKVYLGVVTVSEAQVKTIE